MKWALYNLLKGWTLTDLTEREVRLLIASMSANEIRLTKIAKQNQPSWDSLTDTQYAFLLEKPEMPMAGYPTTQHLKDPRDSDTGSGYFIIQAKKKILPRLHQRYDLHIESSILSANKNFETKTQDISEGGIQFEDIVPDWVAGYFVVVLHTGEGDFQVMCSLVEDQKEKRRVQIVSEDSDPQYCLFKEWLVKN